MLVLEASSNRKGEVGNRSSISKSHSNSKNGPGNKSSNVFNKNAYSHGTDTDIMTLT